MVDENYSMHEFLRTLYMEIAQKFHYNLLTEVKVSV